MSKSLSFRPFEYLSLAIYSKPYSHPTEKFNIECKGKGDEYIFSEAMQRVNEIKEFSSIPVRYKKFAPVKKKKDPDSSVLKILEEISNGIRDIDLSDTQEYVQWYNSNYSIDNVKRLHEGCYSIQDYMDLHGLTIPEAEVEVDGFLKSSLRRGLSCIKIIHGRGLRSKKGHVIKDKLISLLSGRYRKNIIAFVSARQCDGGLGAVYVLLKKKRFKISKS